MRLPRIQAQAVIGSSLRWSVRNNLALTKARAIDFLVSRQDRFGFWSDFNTLAGSSDEWVTAYVGSLLSELDDERALQAAGNAWQALRKRQRRSTGWGYNRYVPADADSTLWALRLADRLNTGTSPRIRKAWEFVGRHVRSDGAIAAYAEDGPIRFFTGLQRNISFAGWCGSHPCVTAIAAGLAGFGGRSGALEYLRQSQRGDGTWVGYWWCDHEFTSSLVVEALATSPDVRDRARIDRTVAWAANRLTEQSRVGLVSTARRSAFCEASCLRILAKGGNKSRLSSLMELSLARLCATQHPDGSWLPSARLRIPPPGVTDPERYVGWTLDGKGGGSIQVDLNRCFTTVTVLRALQEVENFV